MEAKILTFVLTFLLFVSKLKITLAAAAAAATTTTTTTSGNAYENYLKTACSTTTYPTLCYNSLSTYTSKIKNNNLNLCNTALSITLKAASNTSVLVKSLAKSGGLSKSEASVVKDCVDEFGDCIDELKQSLSALGSLKASSDVEFQIANVKTWVSAAITDENTCTDGFDEAKVSVVVKNKIKKSVLNVAKLTSNALALINKLSY